MWIFISLFTHHEKAPVLLAALGYSAFFVRLANALSSSIFQILTKPCTLTTIILMPRVAGCSKTFYCENPPPHSN